jgi:hypothetical protein
MSNIYDPREAIRASATCADAISVAMQELAVGLRASLGSEPGETPADVEIAGYRQRQIVEIEELGDREGMKVADISRALGGYDVANTSLTLRSLEKKGAVELVPGKTPQHWRLSETFATRQRVWDPEELILVLDRFVSRDGQTTQSDLEELRDDLSTWALNRGCRGRSAGSVAYKVENFRAIATDGAEGMPHVGRGDRQVWEEYSDVPDALRTKAEQIREQMAN